MKKKYGMERYIAPGLLEDEFALAAYMDHAHDDLLKAVKAAGLTTDGEVNMDVLTPENEVQVFEDEDGEPIKPPPVLRVWVGVKS